MQDISLIRYVCLLRTIKYINWISLSVREACRRYGSSQSCIPQEHELSFHLARFSTTWDYYHQSWWYRFPNYILVLRLECKHTHTHSHSWKEFTLASFSVVGNRQSGIFMLECGAIHPLYILLSINLDAKMSVRTQMYSVTVLVGGWVQQKLSIVTPSN